MQRVHLGFFVEEGDAALAFDAAARLIDGSAARLNLPTERGGWMRLCVAKWALPTARCRLAHLNAPMLLCSRAGLLAPAVLCRLKKKLGLESHAVDEAVDDW
jgi:hypothetical protein